MFFKYSLFVLSSIFVLSSSAQALDEYYWNSSYQSDNLVEYNKELDAQLAVAHFEYHDVKKEIENLSNNLKCASVEIKEDTFYAANCDFVDDQKQDIYGKLKEKQGESSKYVQVYVSAPDPKQEAIIDEVNKLLLEDPITNPRNEWLVSYQAENDKSSQVFENKKIGTIITLTAAAYLGNQKENIKNLAQLFLCKNVTEVKNGINLSNCNTFRYYEIRNLEYPYYLLSSVGIDFLNNKEVMDKYHELQDKALAELAIQIEERKHSN